MLKTCQDCGTRVVPTESGDCPCCRKPFREKPAPIRKGFSEPTAPVTAGSRAAPGRAGGARLRVMTIAAGLLVASVFALTVLESQRETAPAALVDQYLAVAELGGRNGRHWRICEVRRFVFVDRRGQVRSHQ